MMDIMKNNTLLGDYITKKMSGLERLGVFQYYPLKTKFENNFSWKWALMRMIFDIKQTYLIHKARLVVGGHVVESS